MLHFQVNQITKITEISMQQHIISFGSERTGGSKHIQNNTQETIQQSATLVNKVINKKTGGENQFYIQASLFYNT